MMKIVILRKAELKFGGESAWVRGGSSGVGVGKCGGGFGKFLGIMGDVYAYSNRCLGSSK